MTTDAIFAVAAAGLLAGMFGLALNWRQSSVEARRALHLQDEMDRIYRDCVRRIGVIGESVETSEKNAQSSLELLRDGRLGMAARANALRMLRSGITADKAAAELGLARNEVRLLEKVAAVLAPRERSG